MRIVTALLVSSLRLLFSSFGSAPNCGFRHITCSAVSRGPRRYSSCAAKVVVPHLTACWHSTLWRTQQQWRSERKGKHGIRMSLMRKLQEIYGCFFEIAVAFLITPHQSIFDSTQRGTRTRTNTNPNGTEANAAGRSGNACALRKQSKCGMVQEGEGHWPNSSENLQERGICGCCALAEQ